ncbi:pneumococcal-type histidine triad protein [Granulicatella elegans]|uniref:Histidine triad protein n=1 Tax=Granulicatella elegans ATCC 700633 TaxID=626369 RepID=D0BJL4_9LACT|nr:pneumococcal-type histidine triad protein [Granulicatella elegans]EEW93267.1 histidine triad protein [Granulicatella elegans ATCC 700633]
MKPTRKQLWMASLSSVIALSTAACGLFQGQTDNNSQQQVEETTVSNAQMTKFEKLAEEIKNNKPKTIVGEVFENGYLKKHGDHYHFVYGAPPADAIYEQKSSATAISSADDGYVFNPNDIVEENEMGYVVRHGDHFHFIYKNNAQQTIATTLATNSVAHEHHEEDGYVFDKKDVVSETETGYVVRHGDHFHFIYKDKQGNPVVTTEHHEHDGEHHDHEGEHHDHDGYVFDKKDIVSETAEGYVVRHGDHFHFIYKDKDGKPAASAEHHHHEGEHHDHEGDKHDHEGEHRDHEDDKHNHEGEHHDHDGYVFDKKDIVSETAEGYVVRHGDHFHFIYKDKQGNPILEHHDHEGDKHEHEGEHHDHEGDKHEHEGEHHDHEGDKHEHEGEHHDHDHDGFVFRKEDIVSETESGYVVRHGNHFHFVYKDKNGKPILGNHHHEHEGDKHEHEGEHHDHDGDKHEHEGEHHDHEGDKHDHEGEHHDNEGEHHDHDGEVTSDNHDSTIPNEKNLNEKSPEVQKYLDYIAYAYGVERDSIKLESAYKDGKYVGKVFAFQNMEQGQDKTHIHPWAIPLRNFEVPSSDESIDPELRFAQEIASLAKRMGISVKDIRILGDKFEVPHGDHSHSLKIQNIEGAKKYVANKLKEITPTYIAGDLDTKAVENQIESLANKAAEKYKTQPVELSRILTSLREIKERLDEKGNSTQGYLELLKQFDEKYIEKASTVTTPELSKEEKALNALHESVIRMINELELKDYNVTKDELRAAANKAIEAKDMKALEAVRDYVQALQDANKRLGVEAMKYLYFFTQHVQDKPLPFELREKVSELISKISKAKFIPGETGTTEAVISPSYLTKNELKKVYENPSEKVDTRVGEKYKAIAKPDDEESMSKLAEMKEMAEIALDQEDKDNSIPTSDFTEELSEEVKKDLATPKSKDQATSENTTTPKAEETSTNVTSTPTEKEKPVANDKVEENVAPTTATTASQPATSASEKLHA